MNPRGPRLAPDDLRAVAAFRLDPRTVEKIAKLAVKIGINRSRIVDAAVAFFAEKGGKK